MAPGRPGRRKPRIVAVIGAGGFIGTNLSLHLAARGTRVRALSRSFAAPLAGQGRITVLESDMDDPAMLQRAVGGSDAVVHLALGAAPRSTLLQMIDQVARAIRLMHLSAAEGARLVFLSSGGAVYGPGGPVPSPEEARCRPISPYGATCLAVESYLHVAGQTLGLDHRVLRVANPYGPHQSAARRQGVVAAFLEAAMAHRPLEIWGDGSAVRDYLHIGDVLAAIDRTLVHEGPSRIFNIGSGEGHSIRDIAGTVEALHGRALPRTYRPANGVDVPVSRLDIGLARRELGWQPTIPLAEGLAATHGWMLATQAGAATTSPHRARARQGADSPAPSA